MFPIVHKQSFFYVGRTSTVNLTLLILFVYCALKARGIEEGRGFTSKDEEKENAYYRIQRVLAKQV